MTQRFKPSYATVTANFRSGTSQSVWAAAARPLRRGSNALSLLTRPSWRGMTATWANGLPPFAFSSNSSLKPVVNHAEQIVKRRRATMARARNLHLGEITVVEPVPVPVRATPLETARGERPTVYVSERRMPYTPPWVLPKVHRVDSTGYVENVEVHSGMPATMLPAPSRAIYPVSEIARRIVKSVRHELRRGSCGAGRFRSGCACTSLARTPSRPRDEWQVPRLRRPVLPASEKMCCVRSESQGGFHASVTRTAQGRTACVSG